MVDLAQWSQSGINLALSKSKKVVLSEFNSASCGGIEGISDTFAVGSLWTIDYALQLASVGYTAAYVHTRESGISYNIFAPPATPSGAWTTNPPFYALMVVAEALQSKSGNSTVVDLNIGGSINNTNVAYSGYAVYDASDKTVQQLVFFNFANVSASSGQNQTFKIPSSTFPSSTSKNVVVKYLVGNSMLDNVNIGWGGQTYAGVGNAKMVSISQPWAPANIQVDCSGGCSINVPAPGVAVVFAGSVPANQPSSTGSTALTSQPSSTQRTSNGVSLQQKQPYLVAFLIIVGHYIISK